MSRAGADAPDPPERAAGAPNATIANAGQPNAGTAAPLPLPHRPRAGAATTRLLRVADWGQISLLQPADGETPRLLEELPLPGDALAALGLCDAWQTFESQVFWPMLSASIVPSGAHRQLRIEREVPRGSHLGEVISKSGAVSERTAAALLLDLARAMQRAHEQGLLLGILAPELVFLCPAGQDDCPPVQLHDAGLLPLLQAGGVPLGTVDGPQLRSLLLTPETAAPEILSGHAVSAATDVYALSALTAYCLLRRHLHAAATPGSLLAQVERGLGAEQTAQLLQEAPRLGPILLRGIAMQAWGRAGVLGELITCFQTLVGGAPTLALLPLPVLAPWAVGSPLMPLAAYAQSQGYAERFATPARSLPTRNQAPSATPDLSADKRAALTAALQRLDLEQQRSHKTRDDKGKSILAYVVVLVVFLLLAAVVVTMGLRRASQLTELPQLPDLHRQGHAKPALPPGPPQPHFLGRDQD